jgi:UDP-N-acetylglucosamine 2-epimerase (non-hydrolysing)
MTIHITFVFGTRPELVKLAPLILLAQQDQRYKVEVIFTAQHDELVRDAILFFNVPIHHRLDMMLAGQTLNQLLARGLTQIEAALSDGQKRDVIVIQGDTTTVLAASLVAFALRIPIAHIEAGLRSFDMNHPFPEEANRQLTSRISRWHFAPTEQSAKNLINEAIDPDSILVTGNTVVDAVHWARAQLWNSTAAHLAELGLSFTAEQKVILVTAHRRENFGRDMINICAAIQRLTELHSNLRIVWPVHLNPAVRDVVHNKLGNNSQVHLLPPLGYPKLMALLQCCTFALTDSGGIQEECPSFRKPVLILRTTTERPEVVQVGAGRLVGTDFETIVREASRLLQDTEHYKVMANSKNPFGDGKASRRILDRIATDLS